MPHLAGNHEAAHRPRGRWIFAGQHPRWLFASYQGALNMQLHGRTSRPGLRASRHLAQCRHPERPHLGDPHCLRVLLLPVLHAEDRVIQAGIEVECHRDPDGTVAVGAHLRALHR